MRKLLAAFMLTGLSFVSFAGVAQATHNTTIVYNCPSPINAKYRTNVTFTVPTSLLGEYDKRLKARGCTKVSSTPVQH